MDLSDKAWWHAVRADPRAGSPGWCRDMLVFQISRPIGAGNSSTSHPYFSLFSAGAVVRYLTVPPGEERGGERKATEQWSRATGKRAKGSNGSCHWYRLYLRLGYCCDTELLTINSIYYRCSWSNTAKVWVVTWCHFVWQQVENTNICGFLGELMLNCCKRIQIQRDKTNKLIRFCFP